MQPGPSVSAVPPEGCREEYSGAPVVTHSESGTPGWGGVGGTRWRRSAPPRPGANSLVDKQPHPRKERHIVVQRAPEKGWWVEPGVGRRAPGKMRPDLCPEGSKGQGSAQKKGSLPPSRLALERAFGPVSPPRFSPSQPTYGLMDYKSPKFIASPFLFRSSFLPVLF